MVSMATESYSSLPPSRAEATAATCVVGMSYLLRLRDSPAKRNELGGQLSPVLRSLHERGSGGRGYQPASLEAVPRRAYFQVGKRGEYWSVLLNVSPHHLIGQFSDLWECLKFVVLREVRLEVPDVTREVAVDPLLDEL